MDYYQNLYFAIDQLIEGGEDADVIFDNIIDHLAYRAEDYQSKANSFKSLLDLTRNNDPVSSLPERPDWEEIYGGMSDINKTLMSGSPDDFLSFIRDMKFESDK